MYKKIVIVGSGLFGLTIAERIASVLKREVIVLEKRSHIGGNAWSEFDQKTGIEIHKYGSHLFHTSHEGVWKYVNLFTSFNSYRHQVLTIHKQQVYPMPINLSTMSQFFGKMLTPNEAQKLIFSETENYEIEGEKTFEKIALKSIGHTLYNSFIKGYTEKQWQIDPKLLPPEIFTRLPVRFNYNNRYFNDKYEGLPTDGYQKFIHNISSNNLIKIQIESDYFENNYYDDSDTLTIYTGPLDRFFDYKHGQLGWRTLDFEIENIDVDDFQGTSVMNYADKDVKFTRIHEFQHLHPERQKKNNSTIIMKEYSRLSQREDEPYYPVNSIADRSSLELYRKETNKLENVIFGGRLGTYQYLDMHMAIASALNIFENQIKPRFI
jgi:UDP-galactopyranose mutase